MRQLSLVGTMVTPINTLVKNEKTADFAVSGSVGKTVVSCFTVVTSCRYFNQLKEYKRILSSLPTIKLHELLAKTR